MTLLSAVCKNISSNLDNEKQKKKLKVDMPSNANQEKIKMAIPYLKKVHFRGKNITKDKERNIMLKMVNWQIGVKMLKVYAPENKISKICEAKTERIEKINRPIHNYSQLFQ